MQQKLSAMNYIKNNKRKVSVLVVSLTMCFVLFYLAQFLLSAASETFRCFVVDNTQKVQYVYLPGKAFNMDYTSLSEEEIGTQIYENHQKLGEELEEQDGIKKAYPVALLYVTMRSVVGQYGLEVPLLPKEEVESYLQHFDAELVEGKMPEETNELLLDQRVMKNGEYQLGDSIAGYPETKIVGVVSSEYYLACGVSNGINFINFHLCILLDESIEDMTTYLHEWGYEFEDNDASIIDVKNGKKALQEDIIDSISPSTNLIYIAITVVLGLLMLIVYISYLRDRRNEWCFYCSIGFSRKTIYTSVMRELLFTFGFAILLAIVIISISVVGLDYGMMQPMGLKCRYFYPDVVVEILCAYAVILGILQLPIRYALHKIQTIDAIDDDLN